MNFPSPHIISYMTLRKAIGVLGVLFPVVLVLGSVWVGKCDVIQDSISHYYHTIMRDVFVGILCAVALFLYCYKGHDKIDNVLGNLGGIFALGVAFLPTSFDNETIGCNIPVQYADIMGTMHFVSATLFFSVLISFSLFLFTKSDTPRPLPRRKQLRNRVYIVCGIVMITCIVLIAVYFFVLEEKYPNLHTLRPVFWLESVALWAFGISWLIKGELVLEDKGETNRDV